MKKGFTLIELLAVIVILAVISIITVPMILNVVDEAREAAFKDSMYSAFNAVDYYVIEKGLGDIPESGIEAEFLDLKNNNFKSGRFIENIDGTIIAEFVSDGKYCATGSLTNLNVSKGECEISAPSLVIAVNGKEATITITDENGIVAYALTTSSEEPTEWLSVIETTSITETKTAEAAGTYYIHVKNKYGKVSTKEYVIETSAFCAYQPGDVVATFDYSGNPEEFTVPCDGTYKLEVWGAQGGSSLGWNGASTMGGKGGYALGSMSFDKEKIIYIVVGGAGYSAANGSKKSDGYNGGAGGATTTCGGGSYHEGGGGGATHIAVGDNNRGVLANYELYQSEILIVAGGGGGGTIFTAFPAPSYTAVNYFYEGGAGGTGGGSSFGLGASYGGGGGYEGGISGSFYSHAGYGGTSYVGGVTDGATENGVREGNGYAQITLVSISE